MYMDFMVPGIGNVFDLERFDADTVNKLANMYAPDTPEGEMRLAKLSREQAFFMIAVFYACDFQRSAKVFDKQLDYTESSEQDILVTMFAVTIGDRAAGYSELEINELLIKKLASYLFFTYYNKYMSSDELTAFLSLPDKRRLFLELGAERRKCVIDTMRMSRWIVAEVTSGEDFFACSEKLVSESLERELSRGKENAFDRVGRKMLS
ncbi:MAG: hypothetical protein IIZ73_10150 [Ruminococcus sp.]|nr:hypothetical protein [Ruminococcus sp.]